MIPRIKICCISSIEESRIAVSAGASALGLVGNMPSGPGVIPDDLIAEIAKSVPPPVATFLLTCETSAEAIIQHYYRTRTSVIQIVDTLPKESYQALRSALPGIKLVKVIHVLNEKSVDEALEISGLVDTLLLDSGNPGLAIKELGGTGRTHDWKLSRRICEQVHIPVFLAGGLNPGNIRRAVEEVQPFGVDICSGVRTNGHLDPIKLDQFMTELYRIGL
jgi:phosphoribosylanthranilate isomerase